MLEDDPLNSIVVVVMNMYLTVPKHPPYLQPGQGGSE